MNKQQKSFFRSSFRNWLLTGFCFLLLGSVFTNPASAHRPCEKDPNKWVRANRICRVNQNWPVTAFQSQSATDVVTAGEQYTFNWNHYASKIDMYQVKILINGIEVECREYYEDFLTGKPSNHCVYDIPCDKAGVLQIIVRAHNRGFFGAFGVDRWGWRVHCMAVSKPVTILPVLPPLPPAPVVNTFSCPGPNEVCIPSNGNTVRWYTTPNGGNPIGTASCVTYDFKVGVNILYTEYETTGTCKLKSVRSPYTVIVDPSKSVIPPTPKVFTFCKPGSHTIDIPDNGLIVKWYDELNGAKKHEGTHYTRDFPLGATIVYASYTRTGPPCYAESEKIPMQVIVLPAHVVVPPTPAASTFCKPGSHTISIPAAAGQTVKWYNDPLGNSNHTGASYTRDFPAGLTTVYVTYTENSPECEGEDGEFESIKVPYTVFIDPIRPLPIPPNPQAYIFCKPGFYAISIPQAAGQTVKWYDHITQETPSSTSSTYIREFAFGTTTVYASYSEMAPECDGPDAEFESAKIPMTVFIYSDGNDPITEEYEVHEPILLNCNSPTPELGSFYDLGAAESEFSISPDPGTSVKEEHKWINAADYTLVPIGLGLDIARVCYDNLTDGEAGCKEYFLVANSTIEVAPPGGEPITKTCERILRHVVVCQESIVEVDPCVATPVYNCNEFIKLCPGMEPTTSVPGTYVPTSSTTVTYQWTPANAVTNPNIANPAILYDMLVIGNNKLTRIEKGTVKLFGLEQKLPDIETCVDVYKCADCGGRLANPELEGEQETSLTKQNTASFVAYPNPASDQLTIEYRVDADASAKVSFSIFDAMGRIVFEQELMASNGTETIQLAEVAAGSYWSSIRVNGNVIKTQKLVLIK